MENIFEAKPKKLYKQIVIPEKLAERLKLVGKGSYTACIEELLNKEKENKGMKELKEELEMVKSNLIRICSINHLTV
jgi:hypothetical protein